MGRLWGAGMAPAPGGPAPRTANAPAGADRKSVRGRPTSGQHLRALADALVLVRVLGAEVVARLADAADLAGRPCEPSEVNPAGVPRGRKPSVNGRGLLTCHSGKFFYKALCSSERPSGLPSALRHTLDKTFLHWYKQEPTYHQTLRQRGLFS